MEYLTETSVGDLVKIIQAIGNVITTEPEKGESKLKSLLKNSTTRSQYKGSITSQANKLVMTFPVLCSNTVNPSTASMISKAIERKCTLMIQQLFAANTLIAGAEQGNGIEYKLNDIYTGIDFNTITVDDMINITDTLYKAGAGKGFFKEDAIMIQEVADLSKRKINGPVYESSINESPVSLYAIGENGSPKVDLEMVPLDEARDLKSLKFNLNDPEVTGDLFNAANVDEVIKGLKAGVLDGTTSQDVIDAIKRGISDPNAPLVLGIDDVIKLNKDIRDRTGLQIDIDKLVLAAAKDEREAEMWAKQIEKMDDEIKFNRQRMKAEIEKNKREKKRASMEKQMNKAQLASMDRQALQAKQDYFKKQLMDTDVKKANELVPSMLVVNYAVETSKGNIVQDSAIVGVKTRLISLDSFQIIEKLANKNKDKSGLVKFIKATTGEIKFLKDFVFAIDKAKIDVLSKSKRGSSNPIWKVLERRAAINSLRAALGQKNDASPITTLVVTQEEVDYLRKTADMSLDSVSTANYILNAYNLMGICIVDETSEVAKFLFDGEFNQFDTYSFTSLEKESGDNGMYKKVINLMAKRM